MVCDSRHSRLSVWVENPRAFKRTGDRAEGASGNCQQRGNRVAERRSPTRPIWFGLVQRRRAGGRRSGGSVKMRPRAKQTIDAAG